MADLLSNIENILVLLLILSFLVVAHEWGHFIVARLFNIRVDDFSIGFGNRVWRIGKLGDTEYNVRALPLGGFVKIAGMDPDEEPIVRAKDAMAKRIAGDDLDSSELPLIAENTPEATPYDDPDGFNAKPLWQRSLVIVAGPVMSLVTGVVIFCLLGCTTGIPSQKTLNTVLEVEPGGEGQRIGMRSGDRIVDLNGVPITSGNEMISMIRTSLNKRLVVTVDRNGQVLTLPPAVPKPSMDLKTGKPELFYTVTDPGLAASAGLLIGDEMVAVDGVDVSDNPKKADEALIHNAGHSVRLTVLRGVTEIDLKVGSLPANVAERLPVIDVHENGVLNFEPGFRIAKMGFAASCRSGISNTIGLFEYLGFMIETHTIQNNAGGIVKMADATAIARNDGPYYVLNLAGQISVSLAIFNILPIPILDGGHLLAFFIEWVRRGRKMPPQMQQAFLATGLVIIGVLFILINGSDIWHKIRGLVPQ